MIKCKHCGKKIAIPEEIYLANLFEGYEGYWCDTCNKITPISDWVIVDQSC